MATAATKVELNLGNGVRAQRKLMLTVVEFTPTGGSTAVKEILGVRTEDSSIEFNPDTETSTDILGITYTDIKKTEPQQNFDPMYIVGGSALSQELVLAALKNDINKYNCRFTIYIITGFLQGDNADTTDGQYFAVKHTGCTIQPTGMGGDAYTGIPVELHLSNNITVGTVDKLTSDFVFTPNTAI